MPAREDAAPGAGVGGRTLGASPRAAAPAAAAVSGGTASAVALVGALQRRGWTLAVAESLTGGAVTSAVVSVPGASAVLRGGVVAYATDLKATLLGVDRALLDRVGAVDAGVAAQMAQGVRQRLGADVGLATTGVAGPGGQDGHPPGEVHLAVATPAGVEVRSLHLEGDRSAVRSAAAAAVLAYAIEGVEEPTG